VAVFGQAVIARQIAGAVLSITGVLVVPHGDDTQSRRSATGAG
jgi:hypothetical protein